MEEIQTDTLYTYEKSQTDDIEGNSTTEKPTDSFLNGCDEDDPLDLMDHCDNESIGSNSDVWKGSDSEDEKELSNEISSNIINSTIENPEKHSEEIEKISETEPEIIYESAIDKEVTEPETINESLAIDKEVTEPETINDSLAIDKEVTEPETINDSLAIDKEVTEPETINESLAIDKEVTQPETINESATDREIIEAEISINTNDSSNQTKEQDIELDNDKQTELLEPQPKDTEILEPQLKENDKEVEIIEPQNKEPETKQDEEENKETTKVDNVEVIESPKQNQEKEIQSINIETNEDKSKEKESDGNKLIDNSLPIDVEAIPDKDPLATSPFPSGDFSKNGPEVDFDCQMDYDAEEYDDFDPSLLCPEVSMDVDENPVVTTNCFVPHDSTNGSPLPYEPLFSTFVDDVTGAEILFNLTPEEFDLRKRLYGLSNPVQTTKIHCTACNVHLGSALEGQSNRFVHPLLKVLICKDCYHFYTSGEFEKDEDGSELYCRWCGQGGQVLCCSKCEFVFCKRCIRTNFGRRKMFEIRDSDSWDCFRCNPSQIMNQRVQCYEFFEYIRREMAYTSTQNNPEHWSKDFARCCLPKKHLNESEEIKKAKKRKENKEVDPDYQPVADESPEMNSTLNIINAQLAKEGLTLPKPIRILPKPVKKDNDIEFVRQINPPQVAIHSRPNFRSILPTTIRPAIQPTVVRISAQPVPPPPLVPTNQARILSNALQSKNNYSLKHDWFDKTVRAAARVNSHLSYTLTQLNKAQNQAGSVEELAVVHNKLQEILSSSINSLIQIRKNLRTEFISGIKTVKLPPKKTESFANDDDVICVTPPTMVLPMPAQDPLAITKKEWNYGKPKGYLKVKSVKDLQNISADCITIPDDTPPPQINNENVTLQKVTKVNIHKPGTSRTPMTDTVSIEKVSEVPNDKRKKVEDKITKVKSKELIFIVKNQPANEIRKMMSVKIKLIRENLEELQKKFLSKKH